MGGKEKVAWYVALSKERGTPIKALADMPVLFRYLEPVLEAYNMLSSCRQIGAFGGVGPISLIDMIAYLDWANIGTFDDKKRWLIHLRAMDNAFLIHENEKAKVK